MKINCIRHSIIFHFKFNELPHLHYFRRTATAFDELDWLFRIESPEYLKHSVVRPAALRFFSDGHDETVAGRCDSDNLFRASTGFDSDLDVHDGLCGKFWHRRERWYRMRCMLCAEIRQKTAHEKARESVGS